MFYSVQGTSHLQIDRKKEMDKIKYINTFNQK